MAAAEANGLGVKRIRSVHPRADEPANLFLVELGLAANAAAEPELMPPLILFGPDGKYTAAAEAVFSGPFIAAS